MEYYYYMRKSLDYVKIDKSNKRSILDLLNNGYEILYTVNGNETEYCYETRDAKQLEILSDFCHNSSNFNYAHICITENDDQYKCYIDFLKTENGKITDSKTIHIAGCWRDEELYKAEQERVRALFSIVSAFGSSYSHGERALKRILEVELAKAGGR